MAMACMLINVDAVKLYAPQRSSFLEPEQCSGGLFSTLLLQGDGFFSPRPAFRG